MVISIIERVKNQRMNTPLVAKIWVRTCRKFFSISFHGPLCRTHYTVSSGKGIARNECGRNELEGRNVEGMNWKE
jgi:hypothetical protein